MTDYGVNEYKIVRYRDFADLRDLTYVVQASGGPIDEREFKDHIHPDADASYDIGYTGATVRHLYATSGTLDEVVINGIAHSTIPPIMYGMQSSGYVNLINSVSGIINFVGTSGISIVNNGDGTFDIGYEPSGGAGVTSINTLGGALTLVGVSGVSITDDGSTTITISQADISFTPVDARTVTGHIIPDTDNAYDLGNTGNNFRDMRATSGVFDEAVINGVMHSTVPPILYAVQASGGPIDEREFKDHIHPDTDASYDIGHTDKAVRRLVATSGTFDEAVINGVMHSTVPPILYVVQASGGPVDQRRVLNHIIPDISAIRDFGTASLLFRRMDATSGVFTNLGGHSAINVMDDLKTDRWLGQDSNTIVGIGAAGAGNLEHTTGDEGYFHVLLGNQAGYSTTKAKSSIAIGHEALYKTTTGNANVAIQKRALYNNTTGGSNIAIGWYALTSNIGADNNVGIGTFALTSNTTGAYNIAIGRDSLYNNVGGDYNVALGWNAAKANTEGNDNVVIGRDAFLYNKTGKSNVVIGLYSLQNNVTGDNNMALGPFCMNTQTAGNNNSAIGNNAFNTFHDDAGSAASFDNTDVDIGNDYVTVTGHGFGANNTYLRLRFTEGTSSVPGLTDDSTYRVQIVDANTVDFYETNITGQGTGSGHILTPQFTYSHSCAIGDYSDIAGTNCAAIGYQAATTDDNQVQLGNSSTTAYAYGAVQDRSDKRDKADIQDSNLGLTFINKVRPVRFIRDYREDYVERIIDEKGMETKIPIEQDGSKKRTRPHYGLIAQEVKSVLDELDVDFGGYQDHSIKGHSDILTLGYSEFIAPMIKAIQELSNKVDVLEGKLKK